jgi:hypothetical protein
MYSNIFYMVPPVTHRLRTTQNLRGRWRACDREGMVLLFTVYGWRVTLR